MALGLLQSQIVVSGSLQNIPQSGIMLLLVRSICNYVIHNDFDPLDPLEHLLHSPLVHFWSRLDAHWHPQVTIPAKRGVECQQSATLLIQLNLVESLASCKVCCLSPVVGHG